MLRSVALENLADILRIACCNEDHVQLSLGLLHEFTELLGAGKLTITLGVFKEKEMSFISCLIVVDSHRSDGVSYAMT